MNFRKKIQEIDPSIYDIPAGFKRYGSIMVLRSSQMLSPVLGQAALSGYTWCKSVFQHVTTKGEGRHPQLCYLAGEDNTKVIHRENGVKYSFDLAHTTFSGGNRGLRERLVSEIQDGDVLLDMFAAVGNLSMQPLVHCKITAVLVEQNVLTHSYLQKTLKLNGLPVDIAIQADCRKVTIDQYQNTIKSQINQLNVNDIKPNRIFMGYHRVNESHLDTALLLANNNCFLHLHPIAKPGKWYQWQEYYSQIIDQRGWEITNIETTKVKNYSPGLEHVEFILHIQK